MKKVIRKGVWVRYVGDNAMAKKVWGNMICKVESKAGDFAIGYFPVRYYDGSIHLMSRSEYLADLAIVND